MAFRAFHGRVVWTLAASVMLSLQPLATTAPAVQPRTGDSDVQFEGHAAAQRGAMRSLDSSLPPLEGREQVYLLAFPNSSLGAQCDPQEAHYVDVRPHGECVFGHKYWCLDHGSGILLQFWNNFDCEGPSTFNVTYQDADWQSPQMFCEEAKGLYCEGNACLLSRKGFKLRTCRKPPLEGTWSYISMYHDEGTCSNLHYEQWHRSDVCRVSAATDNIVYDRHVCESDRFERTSVCQDSECSLQCSASQVYYFHDNSCFTCKANDNANNCGSRTSYQKRGCSGFEPNGLPSSSLTTPPPGLDATTTQPETTAVYSDHVTDFSPTPTPGSGTTTSGSAIGGSRPLGSWGKGMILLLSLCWCLQSQVRITPDI